VRTQCAGCSVSVDRGGGLSPAPSGNAPTSGRAGLAIDAHRGRAWRANSPSDDPCLATQLRAEGPGSIAEGVPTSFGTSTYSQCGRFVSTALKLQEEVPIATGEIKSSQARRCGQASWLPHRDPPATGPQREIEGHSWAARGLLRFSQVAPRSTRSYAAPSSTSRADC
jgi:hypothetical protein